MGAEYLGQNCACIGIKNINGVFVAIANPECPVDEGTVFATMTGCIPHLIVGGVGAVNREQTIPAGTGGIEALGIDR